MFTFKIDPFLHLIKINASSEVIFRIFTLIYDLYHWVHQYFPNKPILMPGGSILCRELEDNSLFVIRYIAYCPLDQNSVKCLIQWNKIKKIKLWTSPKCLNEMICDSSQKRVTYQTDPAFSNLIALIHRRLRLTKHLVAK